MIFIVQNVSKEVVIIVTDEFSHSRTVRTVKATPHTVTNKASIDWRSAAFVYFHHAMDAYKSFWRMTDL